MPTCCTLSRTLVITRIANAFLFLVQVGATAGSYVLALDAGSITCSPMPTSMTLLGWCIAYACTSTVYLGWMSIAYCGCKRYTKPIAETPQMIIDIVTLVILGILSTINIAGCMLLSPTDCMTSQNRVYPSVILYLMLVGGFVNIAYQVFYMLFTLAANRMRRRSDERHVRFAPQVQKPMRRPSVIMEVVPSQQPAPEQHLCVNPASAGASISHGADLASAEAGVGFDADLASAAAGVSVEVNKDTENNDGVLDDRRVVVVDNYGAPYGFPWMVHDSLHDQTSPPGNC